MKRKTASFTGTRPIFTGSPAIVPGGFNLDKENQNFAVGDVIPAGTLSIYDEETRKVQLIKTAKVLEVDSEDAKVLSLYVDEFYAPFFAVGDKVWYAENLPVTPSSLVATITKVEENGSSYRITLDKEIGGIKGGCVLVEVTEQTDKTWDMRGMANSTTIKEVTVSEFETAIDVTADTMQYALYERRVAPIPDSQKYTDGINALVANPFVKLTKSL